MSAPLYECPVCGVTAELKYLNAETGKPMSPWCTRDQRWFVPVQTGGAVEPEYQFPWAVHEGVRCVECPRCGFTFSEDHHDANNPSCPCCEEDKWQAWGDRMPDAGITTDDPRLAWYYERPSCQPGPPATTTEPNGRDGEPWKVPQFEIDGNMGYQLEDVDGWAQEACDEINRLRARQALHPRRRPS